MPFDDDDDGVEHDAVDDDDAVVGGGGDGVGYQTLMLAMDRVYSVTNWLEHHQQLLLMDHQSKLPTHRMPSFQMRAFWLDSSEASLLLAVLFYIRP